MSDSNSPKQMKRVHIIGGKNHGKTTLIVELIGELRAQGLCVGTIKHTSHQHELDAPGKDSHRHREAGAKVVGILSRSMNAVFWPSENSSESDHDLRYASFPPMFSQCDLVIVEGDSRTEGLKIEVWRESLGARPLAERDPSITAVVSFDDPQIETAVWPRGDVADLAKRIRALVNA